MTEAQDERFVVAVETLVAQFGRIVLALERLSPPPVDRSGLKPTDKVIRSTLAELTRWEREERKTDATF